MNRAYRIVFNSALGVWQVVAEIAKGHGQGKRSRARSPHRLNGLLLAMLLPGALISTSASAAIALPTQDGTSAGGGSTTPAPPPPVIPVIPVNTLPTGGSISVGNGSISTSGSAMTVQQQSQYLAINWQTFDIGSGASVNFLQPNANAIALNRVLGSSTSNIFGKLTGNGQVWLLNPNGVLFGSSAQVNVGGLVASTLGLSDDDFIAGNYRFSGSGGSVVNQGSVNAGYAALLGETVRNEGTIAARMGTVALAAGNKVTLDFDGDQLLNVQVDEGALHALADNRGLIQADGGTVLMTARAKDALLDTAVNNTGVIRARTVENRDGRILLVGDMDSGSANIAGTLDASAPDGGNGGFIETSAAHVNVADNALITTKAATGQSGTWLIDPTDFTVAKSGGDMTGAALTNALANGDVEIQSTAGAGGVNGDVNIKDTVSWSQNTLTLNAQRDINVFSTMNASGTAGLFFRYGQADAGGSYNIYAPVNLASTGSFRTQSGSAGGITNWTIITSLGAAGSSTGTDLQGMSGNLGGNYVLGADIDASSTATWNAGAGFTPVGFRPDDSSGNGFTGTLDGLGHVIDGLTINNPTLPTTYKYVGMFGYATNARIANTGLTNVSITGGPSSAAGGFVGASYSSTSISNSYVTGSVTGAGHAGGLIGFDFVPRGAALLDHVWSAGTVTATDIPAGSQTLGGIAGGLIGLGGLSITNSYSTADVRGSNYVGGLAGARFRGTMDNSYFAGSIGAIDPSRNIYALGALVGEYYAINSGTEIRNSHWNTDAAGSVGVGINSTGHIMDSASVTGLTTAQMRDAANWTGFNFTATASQNGWVLVDGAMPLLASEWSSYIRNAHQLQLMALDLSADYTLANDIDASATNGAAGDVWYGGSFSPIGTAAAKFTGSFDGQGHVIDGLTIDRGAQDNVGLFGYAGDGAFFANVGLSNANITGRAFVGTLLGQGGNTDAVAIDNAWSSGTVTSTSTSQTQGAIGGLVGGMSGTIANSHSSATVTGHNRVGGLVGQMSVSSDANKIQQISNSYATGDVSATFGYGGGLVGRNFARIANSYATGDVSGGTVLGGLVGYGSIATYWNNQQDPNTKDSYLNVYASGNVTGTGNDVGGLFGLTQGLLGVHNAFATGNVVGAKNVGGLIGRVSDGGSSSQQASLWSVYTQGGTVTGQDNVGGLIGSSGWVHVTNSYSASGLLTATDSNAKLGGLIGGNNTALSANIFIFDNGVWNIETTGTDFAVGDNAWGSFFITAPSGTQYLASGHTVGATTAQMMTVEPYAVSGFNNGQGGLVGYSIVTAANAAGNDYSQLLYSNNIYFLYEGQTYPLLRAFLQQVTVNADLSGANKTYDGQIASGTVGSYTTSIPVDASLILGSLSYATNSANAGTYTTSSGLNVSGGLYSGQLGYEITYSPTTSLTINPAALTITANDASKIYDGLAWTGGNGVTYSGFVNGEDANVLSGTLTWGGSSQNAVNAGSYSLIASGLSSGNYVITYQDGTLNIAKASAVITANSGTLTYNGLLQAITGYSVAGLVNGENASVITGLVETGGSGTNAGTYAHTVSGGSAANYTLTYVPGALTINPASLTITANDASKTYDGLAWTGGNGVT
ncbi:MAG: filamentous hemagglutinin N-terminal domain-containing protein, partial [Thermomonas sp.]|uniref:two-partner secretion domain-containing protein n=1 Tax=Thermomonas sp. TaxID=1971895 RepID=UPI001EB55B9B